MSTALRFAGFCLFGAILGCDRGHVPPASQPAPSGKKTVAKPATPHSSTVTGTVLETMDSGGYTYVHIQTEGRTMWAAGPQTEVAVGDKVRLVGGSVMRNFPSKILNRTFESILFVSQILPGGEVGKVPVLPQAHPSTRQASPRQASSLKHGSRKADIEPGSIPKPDGGFTVAELYAGKKKLNGRKIVIRGRVVKFTPNIMGKNWMHIQDGTGDAESGDLTVTTKDRAKVGDTVVVTGTLTADKNLGSGYLYSVLIEEAVITGTEAPSSSPHQ